MSIEPTKASMTLWQKIAAISKEVGHIEKTGKNEHFKYKFIEHSQVVGIIRPILDEFGVTIDLEAMDATFSEGKRVLLHMRYTVTNADKPAENFSRLWVSEAMDQQDKGINKALTAAEKNVFMKLFHISDVDPDGDEDPQPKQRQQASQAPQRPSQPSQPTRPAPTPDYTSKPTPAPAPVTQSAPMVAQPQGRTPDDYLTEQQLQGILRIAGRKGIDEIGLKERSFELYGRPVDKLAKEEAGHFIKVLQDAAV